MNLDHIQLFILVYNARSFAKVAKTLNIAPSSVSRAIAGLEEQLQARLFQRTTRALSPTELGDAFFHRVAAAVDELELAKQEVMTQQHEPFGTLRVTASTSFGHKVLAPMLKTFHDRYPKIQLELVLEDTQSNVVEEGFDLAIRHGRLRDSNLVARKLRDVRYVLVASKGYLAGKPTPQTPKDIQQHALISFGYTGFNKEWCFRQNDAIERVNINPALTITTASAILACVENDMGIALLPDWLVSEALAKNELVTVLPNWQVAGSGGDFDAAIWLIYPSRAFLPTKTTALIDYLYQHTST
ncbi:MAG: LysR family transcriptional regulator [Pontibacterium sp.]